MNSTVNSTANTKPDTLVLDIGGDVGALVIVAGPELAEQEIEISPGADASTPRSHNVVHARRGNGRVAYTAVFPSVPAGDYTVWHRDGTPHATVTIHGGRVTRHDLTCQEGRLPDAQRPEGVLPSLRVRKQARRLVSAAPRLIKRR